MVEPVMSLRVLLPFQLFAEIDDVRRITVETPQGHYGLLPHRLDCAATLVPGILFYESVSAGEAYLAVDEGVLLKTGFSVAVSVRRAVGQKPLGELQAAVRREYLAMDEQERSVQRVMARLETGLLLRWGALRHG
jgi:F-type H+-transporting ATPase subunit epsilon